jgi:hypothetical protein
MGSQYGFGRTLRETYEEVIRLRISCFSARIGTLPLPYPGDLLRI